MRKSSNPPSSMELLLDAMCNVFGAVLFMAILIGGISVAENLSDNQEKVPADKIIQQQERLKTLASQLKVADMELALADNYRNDNTADQPHLRQTRQLQSQLKDQVHEANLLAEKIDTLKRSYLNNAQFLELINPYRQDPANGLRKLAEEKAALQAELAKTAAGEFTPPTLQQSATLEPWRLLISSSEIFVLGSNSNIRSGGAKKESVSVKYLNENNYEYFTIKKQPGKGIKLEDFSLRTMELPSDGAEKYFVELLVEPDAVDTAARLIWELRKNQLAYNWRIVSRDGATLRSSTRRSYEVAR